MKVTKILSNIVCILIIVIFVLLAFVYKDVIKENIDYTVREVLNEKVIVPEKTYNARKYDFIEMKNTTNFDPNNKDDLKNIYYTVLNNGWNEFTFYCNSKYPDCINDVFEIADKSPYLETINYYVSPYNNYTFYKTSVSTAGEVYLSIDKVYTESSINFLKNYVENTLVQLKINTENPTKNDLKKIHDHLISVITYDDDYKDADLQSVNSDSNNAFGAITKHKAVCSGYTDAFAIFLDRLNIKNIKLTSDNHIWNYVYFDNHWYHVDLTWDDDEVNKNNTNNFFMISDKKLFELDKEKHNYNKDLYPETKE